MEGGVVEKLSSSSALVLGTARFPVLGKTIHSSGR